jgi:hypothetical protein
LNEDFIDLLGSLLKVEARFLVVGAYAMAVHGVPRATGDIDIWVSPDQDNAVRVFRALAGFGAPLGSLGVSPRDFAAPDHVIQIGLPPRRIDVLTGVSGLTFDLAWERRESFRFSDFSVPVLGRADLIANKRAAGRPKDLLDLAILDAKTRETP